MINKILNKFNIIFCEFKKVIKEHRILILVYIFFIGIYLYNFWIGVIHIDIIKRSVYVILFLIIYKFSLMCIYSPNFLISLKKETYYEKYFNIYFSFINKLYIICCFIDKYNIFYYNFIEGCRKIFYGKNVVKNEYKSKWLLFFVKIIYYFPTNWWYIFLMFLLKKYNLFLLWLSSNIDVFGKKYFKQNWSKKKRGLKERKWYLKFKKIFLNPIYLFFWLPSFFKVRLIAIEWKQFLLIRIWGSIFITVLIIHNLHPFIELIKTNKISFVFKLIIVIIIIIIFLYFLEKILVLQSLKFIKEITNDFKDFNNLNKNEKIKACNLVMLMSFSIYIDEKKINNYYYIKQYLVFYQIFCKLIKIINWQTNGFILKNFETELNTQLILFKIPLIKEYDINSLFYKNYFQHGLYNKIEDEIISEFKYNQLYFEFDNKFLNSQENRILLKDFRLVSWWKTIEKKEMQWYLNKNYISNMNLLKFYITKIKEGGFSSHFQYILGIQEHMYRKRSIWEFRVNFELYKYLYKEKEILYYEVEKQLSEYEDYFFLFTMIEALFFKLKKVISEEESKELYEKKTIELKKELEEGQQWYPIKYEDIPNNFISNKIYLKLIEILNKFEAINSSFLSWQDNCEELEKMCVFNFEYFFQTENIGLGQSIILYYFHQFKEEIEWQYPHWDYNFINIEYTKDNYIKKHFSDEKIKNQEIEFHLVIKNSEKYLEFLSVFKENQNVKYEEFFPSQALYSEKEWHDIISFDYWTYRICEEIRSSIETYIISYAADYVLKNQEKTDKFIENFEFGYLEQKKKEKEEKKALMEYLKKSSESQKVKKNEEINNDTPASELNLVWSNISLDKTSNLKKKIELNFSLVYLKEQLDKGEISQEKYEDDKLYYEKKLLNLEEMEKTNKFKAKTHKEIDYKEIRNQFIYKQFKEIKENNLPLINETKLVKIFMIDIHSNVFDKWEIFMKKYKEYYLNVEKKNFSLKDQVNYIEEFYKAIEKKYNYQQFKIDPSYLFMQNWELQEKWYKNCKLGEALHNPTLELYISERDKKNKEIIDNYKKENKL